MPKATTKLIDSAQVNDVDRGLYVTKRQAAFFYDVKPQTITNWMRSGLPISDYYNDSGERLFHLKYVNEWVQKNIYKNKLAELARGRTQEDLRLKQLRAEKLEFEIAKKSGVVVDIEFAASIIRGRLQSCKSKLLGLPKRIAPRVVKVKTAKEAQKVVHNEVFIALEELRDVSPEELINGAA